MARTKEISLHPVEVVISPDTETIEYTPNPIDHYTESFSVQIKNHI